MKKDICGILGIKYPIFQGGMAWVSESTLAAAVSNAGGLGIIAGANAPALSGLSKNLNHFYQNHIVPSAIL